MPWYGFAILNAIAIAGVGLLQKRMLRDEHSLEFVTFTAVVRLILFYLFFWGAIEWRVSAGQFGSLALAAVLGGLAFWFVSRAIRRADLSTVLPIVNLDSGLTALMAFAFLGEKISAQQLLGLIVLITGTYVLQLTLLDHHDARLWKKALVPFRRLWSVPGGHFAFIGLMFYGLCGVNDRFILKHIPWTTYLAYVLPLMTVFYLLLGTIRREPWGAARNDLKKIWPWVLAFGAVYLLSNIANAKAVSLAAVGLVTAIKRSSTLLDILLSGRLFHEKAVVQKALASAIMLIGVILIVTA